MSEILQAVLNVLAIVALVVVGAFIIVFLADLLISIIDGKNGIFFKRSKKEEDVKTLALENDLTEEPKKLEEPKVEEVKEEKLGQEVDLQLAEEERLALLGITQENEDLKERVKALEEKAAEEEKVEEQEEEEEELSDEELDKMYAELIADINKEAEEDEEEKVEEPEVVEEVEEDEDDEKVAELEDRLKELQKQLKQEQKEKDELAKKLEEKPTIVEVPVEIPVAVEGYQLDTLEGLMAKRANLEERLAAANKELKANKKEYVPLARIHKSFERDEAKLRRREAIVAKKKIMLFGVTNYVVDEEKEKELSEELDQLEALRLSVQHCQDVMEENKERYPLLESANKMLKKTVEDLKADIEAVDAKIEALKAKQGK